MHAMQDPKGIQGQFKVVFVPDGGGSPIDVDPAQPGVDQSILINYQNQINQIRFGLATNSLWTEYSNNSFAERNNSFRRRAVINVPYPAPTCLS